MIETVHVVFKTHLDLGFTGTASAVLDEYLQRWIPGALDLADQLAESEDASFVWTTGSWLVKAFLDQAGPAQVDRMERAIAAGRIAWHALPCSTHTELMDAALVEYGLSISRGLDERFGTTRIAAKMTDVPGHTIGLVPLLARAGVRYLHLGVNPVSALPDVPDLFVWRAPDGSEVVVHYQGSYGSTSEGEAFTAPGLSEGLCLAHTNDNLGPPSREEVVALFTRLREQYPRARVVASTLDAFAEAVDAIRSSLPVVEDEIGDTWIHGPAADPWLLSRFRSLLRTRSALVENGDLAIGSAEYNDFSDPLLLIAEHTWGKDQKVFLPDFVSYDRPDFERARAQDLLPASSLSFSAFEDSWREQRERIHQALSALSPANRAVAEAALSSTPFSADTGSTALPQRLGRFLAGFDDTGSLASLVDDSGDVWFDVEHVAARFSYRTFDADDYDRWVADYCRDLDANAEWALPDQTRLGLREASSTARHTEFVPVVVARRFVAEPDADVVRIEAALPEEANSTFGAPERLTLEYRFARAGRRIELSVTTHGKHASRLPEASLLSIVPAAVGFWSLDKLGTAVDPGRVVSGGNRNLHAVHGLRFEGEAGVLTVTSFDAPVVAVGRPGLLRFDRELPDPAAGVHVILHDNLWPTNFPQWFEDDLTYRFRLDFT
ncbi:hypothetical protein AX769_07825 [Frondihabitans sp. PAMC 28766]|uniref:DUF5054 domain-containing protein n=1 Tax=Frondihabitans sp. PAMC 28766 TaxID=1795630 RepID=UPI00078EB438|nr:DUF5054 domain-containing protein [Frondihabitans sp. PAMC 28766]AMM20090.1 hypothetical protein AX769_07825 [Frondihabitans sp. PAMC 28766]